MFYIVAATAILKLGFDLSILLKTVNEKLKYESDQRKFWDNQEELANSSVLQDVYHGS